MVTKKDKPANRPRRADKPFRLAKFPKAKPRKKAGIRNIAPHVTGEKNPVYFNPNNKNHTHGRAGIKFHFDPFKVPVQTEPTLDRGTQTLGNNTAPSVAQLSKHTDMDIDAVHRRDNLVSFGTKTPPPPLHVERYTMTQPPESRSVGTEPNPAPLAVEAGTQADYVSPLAPLASFNWPAAKPRTIDFTAKPKIATSTSKWDIVKKNIRNIAPKPTPQQVMHVPTRRMATSFSEEGDKRRFLDPDREDKGKGKGKGKGHSRTYSEPSRRKYDASSSQAGPSGTRSTLEAETQTDRKKPSQFVLNKARRMKNTLDRPGYEGEARNAKNALRNYMKKHKITMKDL